MRESTFYEIVKKCLFVAVFLKNIGRNLSYKKKSFAEFHPFIMLTIKSFVRDWFDQMDRIQVMFHFHASLTISIVKNKTFSSLCMYVYILGKREICSCSPGLRLCAFIPAC